MNYRDFAAAVGSTVDTIFKDTPTHVWIFLVFSMLLVCYYVRPDPVTLDLVKQFAAALLLSLTVNHKSSNS